MLPATTLPGHLISMASRSARHFRRYAVYLGLLAAAHKFCSAQSSATAPAPDSVPVVPAFQPFLYTHLFSDASGETHLAECEITAVPLSSIAAGLNDPRAASYNGLLAAGNKTVFNQLPVDEVTYSVRLPADIGAQSLCRSSKGNEHDL